MRTRLKGTSLKPFKLTRRKFIVLLTGSILIPAFDINGSQASAEAAENELASGSRILVAYFSRSGNTRVVAGQIKRALNADLFEILPKNPYPEDYNETVEQALQEKISGYRPPLKTLVPDIDSYDTVLLGFPVWGGSPPAVIRTFLSEHNLSGKKLRPFIVYGKYGTGSSVAVLSEHAPKATLLSGFSMQGEQEKDTLAQVSDWLKKEKIDS
ncbi:flavodoxin [Geovibrio thiophilus]|uniref:Flavodoxin n=1 Tax=Geovibrio thiophilus TaxID=139438 RepID=A0A3R5UUA5_9BACT|nr:flavodoxin [Geovibrio thiophilus]QAR32660.1 flavodoxin [Geovibrio thiophilus]